MDKNNKKLSIAIAILIGGYAALFSVSAALKAIYPDPGYRGTGFEQTHLVRAAEGALSINIDPSNPYVSNSSSKRSVKYAVIQSSSPITAFHIDGYYGDSVLESGSFSSKANVEIPTADGYEIVPEAYVFQFSYNYMDIDHYVITVTEGSHVIDFAGFYYFK